jgi:lysophospholipase L1-like esterase
MKRYLMILGVLAAAAVGARAMEPCDFDGVNGDELTVYEPQSGNWFISTLSSQVLANGVNWGWNESLPALGDFDGDGRTDLSVYFRDYGMWFIRTFATSQLLAYAEVWGDRNMIPVPEDYNGDGRTDLGVYQRSTGRWFIKTLGDNQLLAYSLAFGNSDCLPVPGDYNGDGSAEIAIYYKPLGYWFARKVTTNELTVVAENWGGKGMWPVPEDYDGDGDTDLGVYERKTGNWFIKSVGSTTALAFARNFGSKEMTPVPGDFNGDGSADLGVFHRRTGLWFIQTLVNSQTLAFAANLGGTSNRVPGQAYTQRSSDGVKMLCFGDSITYGMGSASDGPETGYPILLEKKLDAHIGGSFFSLNAGDPGESTGGGRDRLPGLLNAYKPDILLLMEGTNDARDDGIFQNTESNLRAMVNAALSRGIRCIIATIPPVIKSSTRDRTEQHNRIKAFNPEIYDIGNSLGIPVAKVYEAITSQPNWANNLIDQYTANHPNDAGYKFVRDAFFEAMRGLILSGNLY